MLFRWGKGKDMDFKGVIFDLDGTLVDSVDDLTTAMNLTMVECGFPTHDREGILLRINKGARDFVKQSLPEEYQQNDEIVEKAFAIYKRNYAEHTVEKTAPYDGIIECVEKVNAKGIPCAVFSNKTDAFVKAIVNQLFPDGTFKVIMGHIDPPGEPALPHKPDPAASEWFANYFGAKKEEIAMVGDSDIDIQFSVNSGFYGVGVSWGFRSPEILLENGAKYIAYSTEDLGKFLTGEIE